MPQPKSSRSSSSRSSGSGSRARSAAASKASAAKPAGSAGKPRAAAKGGKAAAAKSKASPSRASSARASSARSTGASSTSARGTARSAPKRATAAKATSGRRPAAAKPAARRPAAAATREDQLRQNLNAVRDVLQRGVVITTERIQEAMDDAVERGHMTRDHAQDLTQRLVTAGRQQTDGLRTQLEAVIERGAKARRGATTRATAVGDPALRQVDKARRAAGIGNFPVLGYDNLTAAQIAKRIKDLTPAELRKVRDHERRNDKRKSVLEAIERKLS